MSDRIEIEEVSAVEQPPRARVEAAEESQRAMRRASLAARCTRRWSRR